MDAPASRASGSKSDESGQMGTLRENCPTQGSKATHRIPRSVVPRHQPWELSERRAGVPAPYSDLKILAVTDAAYIAVWHSVVGAVRS